MKDQTELDAASKPPDPNGPIDEAMAKYFGFASVEDYERNREERLERKIDATRKYALEAGHDFIRWTFAALAVLIIIVKVDIPMPSIAHWWLSIFFGFGALYFGWESAQEYFKAIRDGAPEVRSSAIWCAVALLALFGTAAWLFWGIP